MHGTEWPLGPAPKQTRKITPREHAMIAARNRGWTLEQIGFAAGITRERTRQLLARHGVYISGNRKKRIEGRGLVAIKCPGCGKIEWKHKNKNTNKYCSSQCRSVSNRKLTWAMIAQAIEWRLEGEGWYTIGYALGVSYPYLLQAVWYCLLDYNLLALNTVKLLFTQRSAGYTLRATGIVPDPHVYLPARWFETLKQRIADDGEGRPIIRQRREYEPKNYNAPDLFADVFADDSEDAKPPSNKPANKPRGKPGGKSHKGMATWNPQAYSDTEVEFLTARIESESIEEIARALQRSAQGLRVKAQRLGLIKCSHSQRKERWSKTDTEFLCAHLDDLGLVARMVNRTKDTVRAKARAMGIHKPRYHRRRRITKRDE